VEDRGAQDQAVVTRVLAGGTDDFGELVQRYQNMVAGVAWRYGVSRDDIEDLVNEVFIKAYRNLCQYRPVHPFSTWLYRLAANHVIDHGRRLRKERDRVEMPEQLSDAAPGAEDLAEASERLLLLREALAELPDHYRDTLFLVYVEGHKVEETARILGLPTGTVKTRLMRGRDALRRSLSRRHPEYFGGSDALP
jgi:RNA polymerase sigma-70 factor (ECF subfamily)